MVHKRCQTTKQTLVPSLHNHPHTHPHTTTQHAYALENLSSHLTPGARALDVGSGSGYLSVAMAHMVRPQLPT